MLVLRWQNKIAILLARRDKISGKIHYCPQTLEKILRTPLGQARRQDLVAGGAKNQKRGPHFQNTVLDVCSNQRAKREMGGHRFQMGGRAPLAPRWRRPWCQGVLKQDLVLDFIS